MFAFDESYDVLIAGGGVAGVAAAVSAARAGARTALVEKQVLLGGLATSGLVNYYPPLCDGRGRQVTFGLAEELLLLSIKYGPGDVPPGWDRPAREGERQPRYCARFNPASFVLAIDELLAEAGVEVWLDTLICLPVMQDDRVAGFEVEGKSGRGVLRAACVVDATGDADVAHRAGAECVEADNWMTLWALQVSLEAARQAVAQGSGAPLLQLKIIGASDSGKNRVEGIRKFSGLDPRDITEFVLTGRRLLLDYYRDRQAQEADGRKNVFPITLPAMPDVRTTRRIAGRTTLTRDAVGRHADEAVGLVADWRAAGQVWEVPYGALLPRNAAGLLSAGRCVSVDTYVWEVTRVIQGCALTGEVAGLAAAMSARQDTTPDALDAQVLRAELEGRGVACRLPD